MGTLPWWRKAKQIPERQQKSKLRRMSPSFTSHYHAATCLETNIYLQKHHHFNTKKCWEGTEHFVLWPMLAATSPDFVPASIAMLVTLCVSPPHPAEPPSTGMDGKGMPLSTQSGPWGFDDCTTAVNHEVFFTKSDRSRESSFPIFAKLFQDFLLIIFITTGLWKLRYHLIEVLDCYLR